MEYLQVLALTLLLAAAHGGDLTGYGDSYATPPSSYGVPNGGSYNAGYNGGHNNGYGHGGSQGTYDEQPKSYQFGYAVRDYASGNDYNRHEASDGNTITGEYRVQLPDGRTQIVSYVADWKNGFRAQVRYEGEARYPSGPTNYGSAAAGYGSPSSGYGPPNSGYGAPAASYGAPAAGYGASSAGYGASGAGYGAPAASYGAPAAGYGASGTGYGAPAASYGAPSNGYSSPTTNYGTPSPYTSATFNNGGYGNSQHHGGSATSSSYDHTGYRK